jgi:hypothetical protein
VTADRGSCREGKKRGEKNCLLILGWTIDDGAGGRKGALAVYTPPERACTVECCVCNIRSPLRNNTWASGVQTGYLEPQRVLRTMSNTQVPPLVNKQQH